MHIPYEICVDFPLALYHFVIWQWKIHTWPQECCTKITSLIGLDKKGHGHWKEVGAFLGIELSGTTYRPEVVIRQ